MCVDVRVCHGTKEDVRYDDRRSSLDSEHDLRQRHKSQQDMVDVGFALVLRFCAFLVLSRGKSVEIVTATFLVLTPRLSSYSLSSRKVFNQHPEPFYKCSRFEA
jgi:hypothetical protein